MIIIIIIMIMIRMTTCRGGLAYAAGKGVRPLAPKVFSRQVYLVPTEPL